MLDKIIVVTGAFGALGQVVVAEAIRRGARVAALDMAAEPPGYGISLGESGSVHAGVDLSDPAKTTVAMRTITSRWGRIDGLINIAGGFHWESVLDGEIATWDLLYARNLRTTLNATKAALEALLVQGGGIVNIGAHAAQKAGAGMGAYAASKAAVHRLTESLAEELKDRGVRVNAVLPSIIDTKANREDMPDADFSRWVSPVQLAEVILFLISDASSAVTGALLPVVGRV